MCYFYPVIRGGHGHSWKNAALISYDCQIKFYGNLVVNLWLRSLENSEQSPFCLYTHTGWTWQLLSKFLLYISTKTHRKFWHKTIQMHLKQVGFKNHGKGLRHWTPVCEAVMAVPPSHARRASLSLEVRSGWEEARSACLLLSSRHVITFKTLSSHGNAALNIRLLTVRGTKRYKAWNGSVAQLTVLKIIIS